MGYFLSYILHIYIHIEANIEVLGSIILREVKEILPRLYFFPKLSFYFA